MDVIPEPELRILSYNSRALDHEMRAACYVPPSPPDTREDCISPPPPLPLLVMLHGYGGSYLDWSRHTKMARTLAGYGLIVAFPDGSNGWYTNGVNTTERREDDLIQDFLPLLQQEFSLLSPGPSWAIGGLSMGGYGAIKLALKYPALFSAAFSHSGALYRPSTSGPDSVFGDPEADAAKRKQESVIWLAEQALCRYPTERPQLFLDCGTSDPLVEENRRFSEHLDYLGYGHVYREMPGHHTWPYWNRAFRTILPVIARKLGARQVDDELEKCKKRKNDT